ncbi:hypothetical protein [Tenacibaculum sp. nBUS_03]|uniref:hypothetical protein n=1 Tax=Tenacibaculum sp. nBUS_03 TaxID=3395320 RepID=UPI003EB7E056
MNTKNYILFLLFISSIFTGCKKTNWKENYRERSKDPFGTFILHNEISNLFNGNEKIYLKKNISDFFNDTYYGNDANYANYICIKASANKLDKKSIRKLMEFVFAGNDAFISLNNFSNNLKKILNISTENLDKNTYNIQELKDLKGTLYLKNSEFKDTLFNFDRNIKRHYFSKFDSLTTIVLGTQEINHKKRPNFIKVYHGKGAIYLHTQPIVFTNYYLLSKKENYASNIFSYLPDRRILWDPQVKSRKNSTKKNKKSVFKFFNKHTSLKWSLYISFGGLLLFLLFNARRKQRVIPTIEKLKNSTSDFTHTIANLYLKEENHKNLVTKKITYFLEKIRTKYLIDTKNLNTDFIEKLASKSANKLSTTRYLINTIIALNKKSDCTQDELMRLNTLIENFFENN